MKTDAILIDYILDWKSMTKKLIFNLRWCHLFLMFKIGVAFIHGCKFGSVVFYVEVSNNNLEIQHATSNIVVLLITMFDLNT